MKYYVVIFLTLIGIQTTLAQNVNRKIVQLSVDDGLTQGSCYSMLKDSRGFMWFTSNEGLNRYDGFEFKNYLNSSIDSSTLRGKYTNGLLEDPYGDLWVGD